MGPPDRLIPNVVAAVDVVLFTVRATARVDDAWQVLLVQRGDAAFGGHWSLPGVLLRADETFDDAARRALRSKAGLDARDWYLEQLATFGAPDRDSRGRVVSVAHAALVRTDELELAPGGGRVADRLVPGLRAALGGAGLRSRRHAADRHRPGPGQGPLLLGGLPAPAREVHPARAARGLRRDPRSVAGAPEHQQLQEGVLGPLQHRRAGPDRRACRRRRAGPARRAVPVLRPALRHLAPRAALARQPAELAHSPARQSSRHRRR